MVGVLNKRWISQGWRAMDKGDSEPMALVFIEELDRHSIPFQHYDELFRRSIDLRARRMALGMSCDDFSVELLIAEWTGEYGLRNQIRNREIEQGRTLPDVAASQCRRCDGLNMENVYDESGIRIGAKKGCDHRPIEDGEGIAVHLERLRALVSA